MDVHALLLCSPNRLDALRRQAPAEDGQLICITSVEALEGYLRLDALPVCNLCVIEAELNWGSASPERFLGFDYGKTLRQRGLKAPLHFLSLFPSEKFDPADPRFSLLQAARYHRAHRLPLNGEDQKQFLPGKMTDDQWEDVVASLISIRALAKTVVHDLKNGVLLPNDTSIPEQVATIRRVIEKKERELQQLLPGQGDPIRQIITQLQEELIAAVGSGEEKPVAEIVEKYGSRIIGLTPPDADAPFEVSLPETRWKVLLVEDEQNIIDVLAQAFHRNGISYEATTSGEGALDRLYRDAERNQITVLLCDLRLKFPGSTIWQFFQGYDLIQEVRTKLPHYLSFFVITSAKRLLLHLTRNYPLNISADYKNDVLSSAGAANLYCQKIRKAGDDMFFRARSRPQLSAWKKANTRFYKPLAEFYRDHLFAIDYDSAEEQINAAALDYYQRALRQEVEKDEMEFAVTLRQPAPKEDSRDVLDKFRRHILTGRRIALALYLKGHNEDEVFRLMQPGADVANAKSSRDQLLKTTLAISFLKDLPDQKDIKRRGYLASHLLLEEILFLQDLGFDFDLQQIRLDQEDRDRVWGLLDNIQHVLKSNGVLPPAHLETKWTGFTELSTERLAAESLKDIKDYFRVAHELAAATGNWSWFREEIQEDLPGFQNEPLRQFLAELVS